MTRRAKIACLVTAGVFGIGFVFSFVNVSGPVDRGFKNADLGGCQTEVDAVARLGQPGHYGIRGGNGFYKGSGPPPEGRRVEWWDDHALVVAWFNDEQGYMTRWVRGEVAQPKPWYERVRRYLREQWD